MNQQILSQDEVDALLQGITGESQKLEQEEVETGAVRTYDISSQERIVRGRMPTMEIINERFARNVRIGLFNFIRKSPEISIGPIKVQKYSAFLREIVVPTNFNIVSVRPLRGSGLIVCDPSLVFAVIDALFGGVGKFHTRIEGRDFSPTEQRVIRPDAEPQKGFYYRSDHFEFAKQGVPALYVEMGIDEIGQPAGTGLKRKQTFDETDYHKPSDDVKSDWNLAGAVDDLRALFRVGYVVANANGLPEWKPGTEFKAKRDSSLEAAP